MERKPIQLDPRRRGTGWTGRLADERHRVACMHQTPNLGRSLLSLALVGATLGSAEAAILIDGFTTYQNASASGGTSSAWNHQSAPEALGGERELVLDRTSPNTAAVEMDVAGVGTGIATYASDFLTSGRGSIVWDGPDASAGLNAVGLGGIDLTQGGANDRFLLGVTSDLGASIRVRVYQDAVHVSQAIIPVPADPSFNFAVQSIPFGAFAPIGASGGANLAAIGAITLTFEGTIPGVDIGIESFVAVPESRTLAAGMALAAFWVWARASRRGAMSGSAI